jgi:phospholipid/cholesterol/gamma-HCH transport system substrate-binding protein
VTGLLYIDLSEDRSGRRIAPPVASLRYPVIRAAPSRFDVFLTGLPELVAAVGNLVNRADRLLSDENIAAVTAAVGNLDKASGNLPRTIKELNSLIAELRGASAELAASAGIAHGILQTVDPDIRAAAQRTRAIADNLADASSQLDKAIAENRQDIRSFTHQGLPEIERFVREGRAAAHDIRELSNSLRENPAQLLYQPPARGVEIPR